ncbi:hypothetical protein NKH16_20145 [Mesorhizobium sp. M1307]|uniref:hypothetical protein n=1 Tax=Mesorhizobium sp. M1307 TaxID=2957079 RepID=UPI0033352DA5
MSRASISISDLQQYAERLPSNVRGHRDGHRIRMPVHSISSARYQDYNAPIEAMQFHTIEFHSRPTTVDGVSATAWYYHDILVKVSV